ncbi:MAG: hypothetical protein LBC85_12520 [Fibromonadaceae bacterium]|jgi:carbamoyl-phosphate synthase small subunit|nr:hypothetical protein [Fibromonadaceae bacterium]
MNFREKREKKAFLALADGSVFYGYSVGAPTDALGEAVFNTEMIGYQEILSDPAYTGKLVLMTAPEMGCHGISGVDKIPIAGCIVREISEPSNWSSEESLGAALVRSNVPAIAGVDTRALTILLREKGNQKAFLCTSGKINPKDAVEKASKA